MTHGFSVVQRGRGKDLLLLHGLMGNVGNWAEIINLRPSGCRATALELPFFQPDLRLDSIELITDYVRAYMDEAGMDQAVIGGNSLGGHIALHLALAQPDRVSGLVLTGSSGLFEKAITGTRGANPPRSWIYDKMCEVFYDEKNVTDKLVDEVHSVIRNRRATRDLVRIAKSAKGDNLADRLDQVRCPTLLIWGRQDEITPPDVGRQFHSLIPTSRLSWLDRCGHAPNVERPFEFAEQMRLWWSDCIDSPRLAVNSLDRDSAKS
jgi:pimeloyl-ACP methyl ester carboxylesterase